MPVFPSQEQAQQQLLVRVPVPAPVVSNKQEQQPVEESQTAAEGQQPIRDTAGEFTQVQSPSMYTVIIPYHEELPLQQLKFAAYEDATFKLKYNTQRAPKDGLISRGQFIRGGQFAPNTPPQATQQVQPIVNDSKPVSNKTKAVKAFLDIMRKHKQN